MHVLLVNTLTHTFYSSQCTPKATLSWRFLYSLWTGFLHPLTICHTVSVASPHNQSAQWCLRCLIYAVLDRICCCYYCYQYQYHYYYYYYYYDDDDDDDVAVVHIMSSIRRIA